MKHDEEELKRGILEAIMSMMDSQMGSKLKPKDEEEESADEGGGSLEVEASGDLAEELRKRLRSTLSK